MATRSGARGCPGSPGPAHRHNGPMESAAQPPARTTSSLVSARLILRPVPWDAVRAITAGDRLDDWAGDYPGDGDVMIAGLLQGAEEAAGGRVAGRGRGRFRPGPGGDAC